MNNGVLRFALVMSNLHNLVCHVCVVATVVLLYHSGSVLQWLVPSADMRKYRKLVSPFQT